MSMDQYQSRLLTYKYTFYKSYESLIEVSVLSVTLQFLFLPELKIKDG